MKRRDFMKLSAGLGALATLTPLSPARAQAKSVFKASDVQPPGYPTVAATENLGKKLEAATNGRLSVQMFPSMQLGGEKETIEQTQIGAIQMLRVSVGAMGPIVDDINVVNMPFLFKNTAHAQRMMDGPIGQELLDKVTASPNAGLVALCWMDSGARSLYNTKKPIKTIEDLKGMKFRVIGNPIFVDMMNALGGNGVAMGYDQVFSALQTGVIDGAEILLPHRASYSSRNADVLEEGMDRTFERGPGPPEEICPRGADGRARTLETIRAAGDGKSQSRRLRNHRDCR